MCPGEEGPQLSSAQHGGLWAGPREVSTDKVGTQLTFTLHLNDPTEVAGITERLQGSGGLFCDLQEGERERDEIINPVVRFGVSFL